MVLLFAASLLLIFLTESLGMLTQKGLEKVLRVPIHTDLLGVFLMGLIASTVYFNIVSFWLPVNYLALLPLLIGSIFACSRYKESFREIRHAIRDSLGCFFSGPRLLITVLVLAVLFVYWILPPGNVDSTAYHYLAILWYEKYKVVPGLGNLHGRFAYNPVAFILQAPYSFTGMLGQSIYPLNGVITALFMMWVLARLFRTMYSIRGLLYFVLIVLLYRPLLINLSSPTSDTLVLVCLAYALIRLFEGMLSGKNSLSFVIVPSLIILYSLIAKVSSFPVLLVLPYVFYLLPAKERCFSLLGKIFAISLLLYVPWLARNYIMSGYLIYPFSYTGIFHPDWKVSPGILRFETFYLTNWTPLSYGDARPLYEDLSPWHSSIHLIQKFFYWCSFCLRHRTPLDPLVFILGIISPLYWIPYFIRTKKRRMQPFILWLIVYAGAWTCTLVSSEFRYAIALLILSILFPFLTPTSNDLPQRSVWCRIALYMLFMASTVYYIEKGLTKRSTYHFTLEDCWLFPLKDEVYKNNATAFPYATFHNGVKLYLSDSTHNCINAGMPCKIVDYGEIDMRGDRLDQGFRTTKDDVNALYPFIPLYTISFLLPSHLPQKGHMRGDGIPYPGIFDIDQAIFLAGLPDDLADRRIMNMRYFGEKMMFDLEIQPPDQPGDHRVTRSEIGRRLDLVNSPLIFQFIGIHIGHGESRMLDGMRQLEYEAQYKPCHTGEDDKADHPIREPDHINGKHDEK